MVLLVCKWVWSENLLGGLRAGSAPEVKVIEGREEPGLACEGEENTLEDSDVITAGEPQGTVLQRHQTQLKRSSEPSQKHHWASRRPARSLAGF